MSRKARYVPKKTYEEGSIAAALVLHAQKIERRTLALLSHNGEDIALTQTDVIFSAHAVEQAILDAIS